MLEHDYPRAMEHSFNAKLVEEHITEILIKSGRLSTSVHLTSGMTRTPSRHLDDEGEDQSVDTLGVTDVLHSFLSTKRSKAAGSTVVR